MIARDEQMKRRIIEQERIPWDEASERLELSANSLRVLAKRYLRRDLDGNIIESPAQMFRRVAYHIALADKEWGGDVEATTEKFYEMLTQFRFMPNSPTFTGAGTPLGQLAACFTEHMRVVTDRGLVRIADLQVGDRVLTHKGRFWPVTQTMQRYYEGDLYRIKVRLIGVTLEVTPEHPILTPKGWVEARELKVGDRVAIGLPRGEVPPPTFDLAQVAYAAEGEVQAAEAAGRAYHLSAVSSSDRLAGGVPRYIALTPELARLCGYYVAEGTVGPDEHAVCFTLGREARAYQQDIIQLVEQIFGCTPRVHRAPHGRGTHIVLASRVVAAWFKEHFGAGSAQKRVPLWLMFAPREIQEAFLIGLLRGDGVFFERVYNDAGARNGHVFRTLRVTAANPGLVHQIWQVLLRLGYDASLHPLDATSVSSAANEPAHVSLPPLQAGDLIEKALGIDLPEPDRRDARPVVHRDGEAIFFEVEAIDVVPFSGIVYNCEVAEDHTYVTEGVVVHNCFVLPISDDMGKEPDGIFMTLRNAALIQQTGGGNGFSFSRLRPKGDVVRTSAGRATGPVGFLRVYDKAFGEIAQGGCLVPETLVFTDRGVLRLDELVNPEVPGWQPHSVSVATDEGMRFSPHGYNNGVQRVLRVRTSAGLEIVGTPEHKVKVMTSAGPVWRALQDLQPGDAILVKLNQHRGEPQSLVHPARAHHNQTMPTFPAVLDEDLAFFIGYLLGDGFIAREAHDHRVGVSVSHSSYLVDEMPRLIRRLFGADLRVHTQQKPDDASVTYVMDNRALKEFLLLNGIVKPSSKDVFVPAVIRRSPRRVVAAFLRGLFEADGTLTHGYPELITPSERLAREVATLLIGLGVSVHLSREETVAKRWGSTPRWRVQVVSHRGLKAWREHIGADPRSRFAAVLSFQPDVGREQSFPLPAPDSWPGPVLEAITLPQIDRRARGQGKKFRATDPAWRRQLLGYGRRDRALTLSAHERLAEAYEILARHAPDGDDLWFVHVEAVEEAGERLTLDLEVEGNHTYLAWGMVTHNTRRGANMAVLRVDHPDIFEFVRAKEKEGELTNFNISVALTDEFMRAVEEDREFNLVNPRDGKVWKTVRARELLDEIVRHAHHNGEPGALFIDTANRSNPLPHLYTLEATNPCVTGDTLVATPQGWRRADEIQVGDEIYTVDGVGRVAAVEINHDMPVYRVRFADGGELRVTASHQFHVLDPETGRFYPKRLDKIQVGDKVRVVRPEPVKLPRPVAVGGPDVGPGADEIVLPEGEYVTEVVSIAFDGVETVYDLYEPETDTWLTAGYVSRGCGEQWLGPYENCCLGSINLAKHVKEENGQRRVDWDLLRETVETAVHFLDNVVSANKYVPAVPQLREAALRARRIGLGIMGLADMMYDLGIRYGSKEAQEFAAQIMEFIRYHAMRKSIELAKERGPFPAIKGSIYDPEDLKWRPPQWPEWLGGGPQTDWGRPPLDWNAIVEGIKKHGIRNAAQTTVAPTGTIATVSGCEGYGCEPVFALAYIRHFKEGDKDVELEYVSPRFLRAMQEAELDEATKRRVINEVLRKGTCQHIKELPEHIRHTFVVAQDITAEEHVYMQAALQVFVDNSISKCVVGDTLVLTEQGLVPIQELSKFRLPDQFQPLQINVLSPNGVERADAFYYGGYRETRKVRLQYGFQIEGTPNHRVHVLTETGDIRFKALDELKPGDMVVLYVGQKRFGPPGQPLPAFSGAFRTSSKKVRFPTHMNEDLAFFLGCLTSEGAIKVNGVNIAHTNLELLNVLNDITKRLFGIQGHISKDSRNNVYYLQINSRPLRHWLTVDLGLKSGAANKIIPTCILKASEGEIKAFLKGLFLDAYVTEDGKLFGITLASEKLIRQLQVLLLNMSAVATVRQIGEKAWNLTVQGQELTNLANIVDFVEVWKNERIARRDEGRVHRYRNYSRLLPRFITRARQEMKVSSQLSLRSAFAATEAMDRYQRVRVNLYAGDRLERQDAHLVFEHLRRGGSVSPGAERFFAQDRDGMLYVSVEEVRADFAEVFDLHVPGSHTFIANGLGNHNTINFPEHATVEDVKTVFFLAWRLGCKGITVYVTGTRKEVVLETREVKEKKQRALAPATTPSAPRAGVPVWQAEATLRPRPPVLQGKTYRRPTPVGTAWITVNSDEHGEPFEVFLNVGKAGSDVAAISEAIGRLISLILRLPSPMSPTARLQEVIHQLSGIGGGRPLGFGPERVRSLPDAIAHVLRQHLEGANGVEAEPHQLRLFHNGEEPSETEIGDICPECGQATFVPHEGCRRCTNCGYSEC